MGRLLILLILALGAGVYFPRSREVLLRYTQPILNPALRWTTNQELRQVAEDLEVVQGSQGTLPSGRGEFDIWLNDRYRQENSKLDAWGNRYTLRVQGDSFTVVSAGPDGVVGSPDDLTESRRLAARARAR